MRNPPYRIRRCLWGCRHQAARLSQITANNMRIQGSVSSPDDVRAGLRWDLLDLAEQRLHETGSAWP